MFYFIACTGMIMHVHGHLDFNKVTLVSAQKNQDDIITSSCLLTNQSKFGFKSNSQMISQSRVTHPQKLHHQQRGVK